MESVTSWFHTLQVVEMFPVTRGHWGDVLLLDLQYFSPWRILKTLCISFPLWNIVKPRGGYLWIRHQCDNLHCTSQSHTKLPQATVWQGTMKRSWGYVMVRGSARLLFQTWASVGCELTAQDHFFISRWRPMSSSGWQKPWGPVMLPSFWQDSCLGCHFKFYDTCLNHL